MKLTSADAVADSALAVRFSESTLMKIPNLITAIVAGVCVILGLVWALQGLNLLPGSAMTGHIEWTYHGAGLAAIGGLLFWLSRRK